MDEQDPKPDGLDEENTIRVERKARRLSSELTRPISLGSREATKLLNPDELERKAIQGPLRRNAPLILAVLAVLALGPALSRVLRNYRAVVLEVKDRRMLIIESAEPPPPPRWIGAQGSDAGAIIEKKTGTWSPEPAETLPNDLALLRHYERWTQSYEGVITKIYPPAAAGSPNVAVVQLADGSTLSVSLWSEHLASAAVGRRLKKTSSSWEPSLVEP